MCVLHWGNWNHDNQQLILISWFTIYEVMQNNEHFKQMIVGVAFGKWCWPRDVILDSLKRLMLENDSYLCHSATNVLVYIHYFLPSPLVNIIVSYCSVQQKPIVVFSVAYSNSQKPKSKNYTAWCLLKTFL